MKRQISLSILSVLLWIHPTIEAGEFSTRETEILSQNAEREAKEIVADDLYGHYDVVSLKVLEMHEIGRQLGRDYGLAKVILGFAAKRNGTRNPTLNSSMFEPGNCNPSKAPSWFYLHCGVSAGHIFDGKLELLLTVSDNPARWTAVTPNWRTLRSYPLEGYLVLEGRQKEGYVLFPKQTER